MSNLIAVAFALSSAAVIAWGTVVRQQIAESASAGVLRTAIRRPLWWVGTGTAVVGYGLQVVALGFGTLLLVQPVLVLSLMFTLPLAAWYQGRRTTTFENAWSLVLTIAVAVLLILGRPAHGMVRPPLERWLPALIIGVLTMLTLAWISRRFRSQQALLLGIVCGGIYGYVAVLSKAVVDIFTNEGFIALFSTWHLLGLVLSAGTGTIVQQYAFHAGPLKHSLPAMTVIEPIVAFSLGYAILNEKFQVDSFLGWMVMALALLVMVTATVLLSQQPAVSRPQPHNRAATPPVSRS